MYVMMSGMGEADDRNWGLYRNVGLGMDVMGSSRCNVGLVVVQVSLCEDPTAHFVHWQGYVPSITEERETSIVLSFQANDAPSHY